MYKTKKEYEKRINNFSINEFQKVYQIDDDIIDFYMIIHLYVVFKRN